MTLKYIVVIILLLAFIGAAQYIHIKRVGNRYSQTYLWFRKLLK